MTPPSLLKIAGNYQFGYNEDHATGGTFRRESGNGLGQVVGSYGLRDADGRVRTVNYVADALGFRANINSNEPGVEPKDPAAVAINKVVLFCSRRRPLDSQLPTDREPSSLLHQSHPSSLLQLPWLLQWLPHSLLPWLLLLRLLPSLRHPLLLHPSPLHLPSQSLDLPSRPHIRLSSPRTESQLDWQLRLWPLLPLFRWHSTLLLP